MRQWVLDYMNAWKEKGGYEFMVFASGGGFWGQIPWGVDPSDAPKYQGHLDFIKRNPVWWDIAWHPDPPTFSKWGRQGIVASGLKANMAGSRPVVYDIRGRRLLQECHYAHGLKAPGVYLKRIEHSGGWEYRKNAEIY
jgi:hypothetical protein